MRLRWSFLLLACWVSLAQAQPAQRTWDLPEGTKSIQVNGYDIAYVEKGAGPPLVLLHGAISDYRSFAANIDALADKHRTIALSRRHHFPERWDGQGEAYKPDQFVSDYIAFIEKLRTGPVHLLGHSQGGNEVMLVAARASHLIRSLIVVEGGYFPDLDPATAAATDPRYLDVARLIKEGNREAAAATFVDIVQGPGGWEKTTPANRQMAIENIGTTPPSLSFTWPPICQDLQRTTFPILLIEGANTPQRFRARHDAIQKCRSGVERVVIPNAGHSAQRQNPAAFNAAVVGFVAKQH